MRGISLIEYLLVVIGISILFVFVLAISLDFYKDQQLQNYTQEILQSLRRAQLKSMSVELDSNFGVYITDNKYTLFKGNFYNEIGRDTQYDEVFDLSGLITIQDSPKEVIFSRIEGNPNTAGSIILNSDNQSRVITINEIGRINLE